MSYLNPAYSTLSIIGSMNSVPCLSVNPLHSWADAARLTAILFTHVLRKCQSVLFPQQHSCHRSDCKRGGFRTTTMGDIMVVGMTDAHREDKSLVLWATVTDSTSSSLYKPHCIGNWQWQNQFKLRTGVADSPSSGFSASKMGYPTTSQWSEHCKRQTMSADCPVRRRLVI